MTHSSPVIQLRNVSKFFGSKEVLKSVDLDVYKGESLVILGGSGSGKSVLLKCILGLLPVNKGKISVSGKNALALKHDERNTFLQQFGMLFQGSALFDSLTVWENITFGLRQSTALSDKKAKEIAVETLKTLGMGAEVADLFPGELSGGMQRRVAIARAVVTNPEIIFFDEPTAGLDPIIGNVINDLIVRTSKSSGATSITITHDIHSARSIADRVAMLHQGEIIWTGSVKELDKSGNPYVDQFIHGRTEGPIQFQVRG